MVSITPASPYSLKRRVTEKKLSSLQKAFNWIAEKTGKKAPFKGPHELTDKEKEILSRDDGVHYNLTNTHQTDMEYTKTMMSELEKSPEAVKNLDEFYKSGGRITLSNNMAEIGLYNPNSHNVTLNVSTSIFNPSEKDVKNLAISTLVHETKHASQFANANSKMEDYNADDSLLFSRMLEGDAQASQFASCVEIATNKNAPNLDPLKTYAYRQNAQYFATGMKALGVEVDAQNIDFDKIDLSKIDTNKLDEARKAVFLEWSNDTAMTRVYGKMNADNITQYINAGSRNNDFDVVEMGNKICLNQDRKSYFDFTADQIVDDGFKTMVNSCKSRMQENIEYNKKNNSPFSRSEGFNKLIAAEKESGQLDKIIQSFKVSNKNKLMSSTSLNKSDTQASINVQAMSKLIDKSR
jgi:hypothetical protein